MAQILLYSYRLMVNVTQRNSNEIKMVLCPNLYNLPRVFHEVQGFSKEMTPFDAARLIAVTRELLLNAIEYGDRDIAGGRIFFRIKYRGRRRFKIVAQGEGCGFDYGRLETRLADGTGHRNARKNGCPLANGLAGRLRFKGDGHSVVVYLHRGNGGAAAVKNGQGAVAARFS